MAHTRRLIAILLGCATWCIVSTTDAYALMLPDPIPTAPPVLPSSGSSGTPLWQILAFMTLGVLLAVAIGGLGYSLSHSRRSEPSPRSHPPLRS
jgi:hypothetical protein